MTGAATAAKIPLGTRFKPGLLLFYTKHKPGLLCRPLCIRDAGVLLPQGTGLASAVKGR